MVAYFFMMGLALMWLGPAAADVQDIVGPRLRGLGVGVYFLVVNLVGYGIGPLVVGKTSDVLGVGTDPTLMRYSLLLCPAACVVAALLLFLGSRSMEAQKA
jgi:MFS family permease